MAQNDSVSHLGLHLLGPPHVTRHGKHVTGFRSAKAQALLYFLAVTGSTQRRSILAALLWPEADEAQASASLRNVLSNLRALVSDHLTVTREAVTLDREALWLDVAQFDALVRRTGDTETDIVQMEAAISLYHGDFLEGFHVSDAPGFEQWATIERERLRQAVLNSLLTLAEWHAGQTDYAAGLDDLTRLLSIDPASEFGHRQKMILLARMGQRSLALKQYDTCRHILAEELGVEPSPQTTAAYELILAGAPEMQPGAPNQALRAGSAVWLPSAPSAGNAVPVQRHDRRDMPARIAFYGRQEDLGQLNRWLATDGAGVVAITGMGGIGKTTLVVELVARLAAGSFAHIAWRSLVNAPPLGSVLDAWLQTVSGWHPATLPESMDEKLDVLVDALRRERCLLVLDNFESIIDPAGQSGQLRAGYEDYGQLIDRMARGQHQSCLLLTSRDLPKGLRTREEDTPRVRILPLEGLSAAAAISLLRQRGISEADAPLASLVARYSGNPLALKLVADTVRDLFGNDVSAFLDEGTPVFDDIREVLDQQFSRLSELGREIVTWLAIERKPVAVQTVWQNLVHPPRRTEFLEAVRSLQNGSLVEVVTGGAADDGTQLALQNVIMEYLTDRLVSVLCDEIESGQMLWLHRHTLVKVQSEEHIQASQRVLLLAPVARWLVHSRGQSGAVLRLRQLLARLRHEAAQRPSYAAANILHLLLSLEVDLRGWDFSGLAVWQADLHTGALAGVDFRGVDLRGSTFAELLGMVSSLAIHPDGRYLAAGDGDGRVFVWRMRGLQSYLVLEGHSHGIGALAFSPDGAVLASGGYDGRVCVWNSATGEALVTLSADSGTITSVAFSPDGNYLVSGAADQRIVVWEWRRGEIGRSLHGKAAVNGLAFSPDGRWLISARDDGQADVWDWRHGTVVRTLSGHDDKLRAVACSPDGEWVATGGEDKRICLWQLADPGVCRVLAGHNGWVLSLAFSPDDNQLISAGTDRMVRIWDTATGQTQRTLLGHTSWVCAVACSPDGELIATGGNDQTVRLWEKATGLPVLSLHGYPRRIHRVSFSSDGALLASSSLDGPVHLWDISSRRHMHRLTGHRGAIRAMALSEVNQVVAGGCDDHRVYLWDIAEGGLKHTLTGHTDLARYVGFSPNGRYLVTGSYDRTLRIWEAATCRLRHIIHDVVEASQAEFCPDGDLMAYCGEDSTVKLCDINSGQVLESLSVGSEQPVVVAFSSQGQLLACGTKCGALWVWQAKRGCVNSRYTLRFRAQPLVQNIWGILISPDGKLLVISGSGGVKQVIDLANGEVVYSLPDVSGAFDLAFSGEGRHLVTAGPDKVIHIRDAASGEVRRTLRGHRADVTSLDVSPAENVIASGSVDGVMRLWDLETGACLARLEPPGPYAGTNIAGATGITAAQRATLMTLGAIE